MSSQSTTFTTVYTQFAKTTLQLVLLAFTVSAVVTEIYFTYFFTD